MSLHYLVKYECRKNWQQSEICIVINDKSQDSTAKHLSYDVVNHCAGESIFKIREHLAKLQAMVDRVIRPIRLKTFVLKDAELAG